MAQRQPAGSRGRLRRGRGSRGAPNYASEFSRAGVARARAEKTGQCCWQCPCASPRAAALPAGNVQSVIRVAQVRCASLPSRATVQRPLPAAASDRPVTSPSLDAGHQRSATRVAVDAKPGSRWTPNQHCEPRETDSDRGRTDGQRAGGRIRARVTAQYGTRGSSCPASTESRVRPQGCSHRPGVRWQLELEVCRQ